MNATNQFPQIAKRIIKEQELIVGPLAWEEARKVKGIMIDQNTRDVFFQNGDSKEIINKLVAQYEGLFGGASHEVCRDAARDLIAEMAPEEIPSSLK